MKLLEKTKPNEILDDNHFQVNSSYLSGGSESPLPVMVWFYGGNFLNGAGSCVLYDGRFMASKGDVIVVTTNYRYGDRYVCQLSTNCSCLKIERFNVKHKVIWLIKRRECAI